MYYFLFFWNLFWKVKYIITKILESVFRKLIKRWLECRMKERFPKIHVGRRQGKYLKVSFTLLWRMLKLSTRKYRILVVQTQSVPASKTMQVTGHIIPVGFKPDLSQSTGYRILCSCLNPICTGCKDSTYKHHSSGLNPLCPNLQRQCRLQDTGF